MDRSFQIEDNRVFLEDEDGRLIAEVTFPFVDEGKVEINHTFVDSTLRGQGVAGELMERAVEVIKSKNLTALASCSYAQSWLSNHPEYSFLFNG